MDTRSRLTLHRLPGVHPIHVNQIPAGDTWQLDPAHTLESSQPAGLSLYIPADQVPGAVQAVGAVHADQLICRRHKSQLELRSHFFFYCGFLLKDTMPIAHDLIHAKPKSHVTTASMTGLIEVGNQQLLVM